MGGYVYRNYFLEIWDGGKDVTSCFDGYPVISFGPGQGVFFRKGTTWFHVQKAGIRTRKLSGRVIRVIY